MPKRIQEAPQHVVKLAAGADGAGRAHAVAAQHGQRLMANSQSPLWTRYTESRLRQFVTRQ